MRHPAFVIIVVLAFGLISGSRSPVLVEPSERPRETVVADSGISQPSAHSPSLVSAVLIATARQGASDPDPSGLQPAEQPLADPAPNDPAPAGPTPPDPAPVIPAQAGPPPVVTEPFERWVRPVEAPPPARVATVIGDGVATVEQPGSTADQHWFANPTQFGGPRVFLVTNEVPGYVEVLLPLKPNGRTGWIPSQDVTVTEVTTRAEVDLTSRMLRVWHGVELSVETPVVIGAAGSPTPVGTFFVRDVIDKSNRGGAYGPNILALSGFSEVLDSFQGGEPAIAIHGTNRPELMGQARSNGCVRIPNSVVARLATEVPLGTPVTILTS